MTLYNWEQLTLEQLNPSMARKVIHGDLITAAQLHLAKGSVVPRHHHVNEQMTVLLKGRLRFYFDSREIEVNAGEVLQISADEAHKVEALEDSVALDLFSPVREDWIRGDDAYLRQK